MGQNWAKDTDGIWKPTFPWTKAASGWFRVKTAYRKTSSTTWSSFFTADLTPPNVAVISALTQDGTRLKISITAPSNSDVTILRVKVGKVIAPNTDIDSSYISSPDGADTAWSEWKVTPNQVRTKYYPVDGTLTNGATYYVTVWAQDTGRNYSQPAVASIKYKAPTVPVPVKRSVNVDAVDSGTFHRTENVYFRNDKALRTGGSSNKSGIWYYSTKLATTLKNAKTLTLVKVNLQRSPAVLGYNGQARFWFFAHNQTGYANVDLDTGGRMVRIEDNSIVHGLARGASGNFQLPESWYPDILSGKIKGFGIVSQVSSGLLDVDPYNGNYYGYGSNSGRVYLEYTE